MKTTLPGARHAGYIFAVLSALLFSLSYSHASERYTVSLLTCSSGDELYSTFGHSAIRVTDAEEGTDEIYNFGMFDFRTPNFYMKFLEGHLDYFLAEEDLQSFVMGYTFAHRLITEQVLEMTDEQAERILDELRRRSLPQNRYYRYRFIERNCTTEIRDLLFSELGSDLSVSPVRETGTYRHYLNNYLRDKPWTKAGINLVLGSTIDKKADVPGSMFLPDELMYSLEQTSYRDSPFVARTSQLNDPPRDVEVMGVTRRLLPAFIVLLVCGVILLSRNRFTDSLFLTVLSLLGLLLCFLTIFGGHIEFKWNLNLLWCNPLLIPVVIGLLARKEALTKIFAFLVLLCCAAMIPIWIFGVQAPELIFIIADLTVGAILVRHLWLRGKSRNPYPDYYGIIPGRSR